MGTLGNELQPLDQDILLRNNDAELRRFVSAVVSRNAFATTSVTYTATGDINPKFSTVFTNAASTITLTLTYANYWGSDRSPLITIINIGSAAATIAASGSDTIDGAATYSLGIGDEIVLISNGAAKWYIISFTKITNANITFSATDKILGRATAGAGLGEEITCTAAGRAILDDTSASAQRTTLGVGTSDSPAFTAISANHILFPATQVASANANALDDYEEGTWTPSDGSGAGLTFSSVTARYTKIGRLFILHATLVYPGTADGSVATISSLPFTEANFSTGALNYGGTGGGTVAVATGTSVTFGAPGGTALTNANMSNATVRFTIPCMV